MTGRAFLVRNWNLLCLAVLRRDSSRCTALIATPQGRVERCQRTATDVAWRGFDGLDECDPRGWAMRCWQHVDPASCIDTDDERRDAA